MQPQREVDCSRRAHTESADTRSRARLRITRQGADAVNRLLRVGFDVTPSDSQLAGISRYTRDLSAALGRSSGVHVERLTAHEAQPSTMDRLTRRTGRRLAYYPAVLDRTAT